MTALDILAALVIVALILGGAGYLHRDYRARHPEPPPGNGTPPSEPPAS